MKFKSGSFRMAIALLNVAALSFCAVLSAQAQSGFSITIEPTEFPLYVGQSLVVNGSVRNSSSFSQPVTGSYFLLTPDDQGISFDDSVFFANAPAAFASGYQYDGPLFTVTAFPDVSPDFYQGTFGIFNSSSIPDALASASFLMDVTVASVPEPGFLLFGLSSALCGSLLLQSRRRSRRF